MSKIVSAFNDGIAVIRLNNGVINAIDEELVDCLLEQLEKVRKEARAMVLCGGEKFFSMGLDLPKLIGLDREVMASLWRKFNQVVVELYSLPVPTVAELRGHAVAGGNIFALTCDYRIGVEGRRKIGLNEVLLGIPVPHLVGMMLEQVVDASVAKDMMYTGRFLKFQEAVEAGLIDALYSEELVHEQALKQARKLMRVPLHAFAATKAIRTGEVVERFERARAEQDERFLDCWFSEGTQALLKQAVERF